MHKNNAAFLGVMLFVWSTPPVFAAPTHAAHASFGVSATVIYPNRVIRAPNGKIRCDGYHVLCKVKKKGGHVLVEY